MSHYISFSIFSVQHDTYLQFIPLISSYSTVCQNIFLVSIIYFINLFVCSRLKCTAIRHAVLPLQYKGFSVTISFNRWNNWIILKKCSRRLFILWNSIYKYRRHVILFSVSVSFLCPSVTILFPKFHLNFPLIIP